MLTYVGEDLDTKILNSNKYVTKIYAKYHNSVKSVQREGISA